MSDAENEIKFPVKVMVNRQKKKVLFAEVDGSFADVLLSFLTFPLGTIVRILKKHYGDEAPSFGSLSTLYNGLANLDSVHFRSEFTKSILLHPRSSSDAVCKKLKLDVSDSSPLEYFVCTKNCKNSCRFQRESMFYNIDVDCIYCGNKLKRKVYKPCYGEVFTKSAASFCISDDLQIVPNAGFSQIVRVLGITDMEEAETMNVSFGFNEVMELLKALLISSTPLSDVIFNNSSKMISTKKNYEEVGSSISNAKTMNLKVMVQRSTNKLLYAEAEEDFVGFLFGFLIIPLGGVESLLSRNSLIKGVDSLYTSAADLIDDKYFKLYDAKNRLIKPNIPHGYSTKFPHGQCSYLKGLRTYKVANDLTVTPFCIISILSSLSEQKIPVSDVEEVQLQIGLKEGLSILKASLTSTSALSDALLNHIPIKQPKREV